MALHANAVTKDCAARVGAGGVDSDDADSFVPFAVVRREAIDECALASAGSASDSSEIGCSSLRKQNFKERFGVRRVILNGGDSAGNGTDLAGADLFRLFFNGQRHFDPGELPMNQQSAASGYYFFPRS